MGPYIAHSAVARACDSACDRERAHGQTTHALADDARTGTCRRTHTRQDEQRARANSTAWDPTLDTAQSTQWRDCAGQRAAAQQHDSDARIGAIDAECIDDERVAVMHRLAQRQHHDKDCTMSDSILIVHRLSAGMERSVVQATSSASATPRPPDGSVQSVESSSAFLTTCFSLADSACNLTYERMQDAEHVEDRDALFASARRRGGRRVSVRPAALHTRAHGARHQHQRHRREGHSIHDDNNKCMYVDSYTLCMYVFRRVAGRPDEHVSGRTWVGLVDKPVRPPRPF